MSAPAVGDMVACALEHTGLEPCFAQKPSRVAEVLPGNWVLTAADSYLRFSDLRVVALHSRWGVAPVRIMSEMFCGGGRAYRKWHVDVLIGGRRSDGYTRVGTALSYAGAVAVIDENLKLVGRAARRREKRVYAARIIDALEGTYGSEATA